MNKSEVSNWPWWRKARLIVAYVLLPVLIPLDWMIRVQYAIEDYICDKFR